MSIILYFMGNVLRIPDDSAWLAEELHFRNGQTLTKRDFQRAIQYINTVRYVDGRLDHVRTVNKAVSDRALVELEEIHNVRLELFWSHKTF